MRWLRVVSESVKDVAKEWIRRSGVVGPSGSEQGKRVAAAVSAGSSSEEVTQIIANVAFEVQVLGSSVPVEMLLVLLVIDQKA